MLDKDIVSQAREALGMQKLAAQSPADLKDADENPVETIKGKTKKAPTYTSEEQRSFARYGLDPKRLEFMQTLNDFMQGLRIQSEMQQRAFRGLLGRTGPLVADKPSYEEFA